MANMSTNKEKIKRKYTATATVATLWYLFFGIIAGELFFLSVVFSKAVNKHIIAGELFWTTLLYLFALVVFTLYLILGLDLKGVARVLKSKRLDVLLAFISGLFLSFVFGGLGKVHYELLNELSFISLSLLLIVPAVILTGSFIRSAQVLLRKGREGSSLLLDDSEGESKKDDLLGYSLHARRFAGRVFNQGAPESLVFGVDAPWGIGKSTFINYCVETWKESAYADKVIVYKFNPLQYDRRTNLFEKFIDGLITAIQQAAFSPEVRPLVSRYSRLIKVKKKINFLGLEFEFLPDSLSVEEVFKDLENVLLNLDRKVIVIVDDLDRLELSEVKEVLFAVKQSFALPNISYVLCYDTENIVAQESSTEDAGKIREFLEKFINIKASLFIDAEDLENYVNKNFDKALKRNLQIDPYTRDKIKELLAELKKIYNSSDFHKYEPYLGDVRKLKQLINTVMLLEIEQTDFDNCDFNKLDLIHLLLIYINYPNLFRKIYNTETKGRNGFFSLVSSMDENYPKKEERSGYGSLTEQPFKNSTKYTEFLESNSEKTVPGRFLIKKLFDEERLLSEGTMPRDISELSLKTLACFNGNGFGMGRNLEDYLKLIVNLAQPSPVMQHRFYLNQKEKINKGVSIQKIWSRSEFSTTESELNREQLWRLLVNTSSELKSDVGKSLVRELVGSMTDYSLFKDEQIGLGLRESMRYYLVKLLDEAGWSDESGLHQDNSDKNVKEIAEWIFGEGNYTSEGILQKLSEPSRGILGFYDMVGFRLLCSPDRGGSFFNLSRALAQRNVKSSSSDAVNTIRELSQAVFLIFKQRYILYKKNIFEEIEDLSLKEVSGNYFSYLNKKVEEGALSKMRLTQEFLFLKTRLKSFLVYQMTNKDVNLGVGCGYYDEIGEKDEAGIFKVMNKYLFGVCFNGEASTKNYEHFIDYLAMNFEDSWSRSGREEYVPSLEKVSVVLDINELRKYWIVHRERIRALKLERESKIINTGNYTVKYKVHLKDIFKMLDELVDNLNKRDQSKGDTA